jgi:hypothetical protein
MHTGDGHGEQEVLLRGSNSSADVSIELFLRSAREGGASCCCNDRGPTTAVFSANVALVALPTYNNSQRFAY